MDDDLELIGTEAETEAERDRRVALAAAEGFAPLKSSPFVAACLRLHIGVREVCVHISDTAFPAVAAALGLPEHHVREDFARWHDSTTAHPWRYRDVDPDVREDPTYRATLDALQTAGLPLVGGGSWR